MNVLTRKMTDWDPFKEMADLQSRLSTLFNVAPFPRGEGNKQEAMTVAEWAPLVDIAESDKEYLIRAEVPGIKKEDVSVTVENGVLTIAGERKVETETKDKHYHRVERAYGRFARSFSLPEDADGSKVSAEYKDGILQVHLIKAEQARPKAIEVKVD